MTKNHIAEVEKRLWDVADEMLDFLNSVYFKGLCGKLEKKGDRE